MGTNEGSKNALTSVTIISALIIVANTIGGNFGYDLSYLVGIKNEIVVLVGAVGVIYGRLRATKKVHIL